MTIQFRETIPSVNRKIKDVFAATGTNESRLLLYCNEIHLIGTKVKTNLHQTDILLPENINILAVIRLALIQVFSVRTQ